MKMASPGCHVACERVAGAVQRHRFTGDHHVALTFVASRLSPKHSGRMPIRVTESQQPVPGDQRNDGVSCP